MVSCACLNILKTCDSKYVVFVFGIHASEVKGTAGCSLHILEGTEVFWVIVQVAGMFSSGNLLLNQLSCTDLFEISV